MYDDVQQVKSLKWRKRVESGCCPSVSPPVLHSVVQVMRVSYGNSITCHAAGLIALSEVFSILKHVMFEPSKLRNPSPQPAEALPTSPLKVVERNVYISVDTEGNPAEL